MRPENRARLESFLCLMALALAPLLLWSPIFLEGQIPLALDGLYLLPPWEEARPADWDASLHPRAQLHARQSFPWFQFLSNASSSGDSILWNPGEGFGAPFLALWRTRALSPFSLPFYLLPLTVALCLSVYLKLFVAGFSAFYAARRLAFPPPIALLVAAAFQAGGPVSLWASEPMSDVMPWFPLLFLFAERLILGQSWAWPLGSIVIALMALGGDPETFVAALLFLGIYLAARRLRDPKGTRLRPAILTFLPALLLGLGLAGVQILPFLEYLGQAGRENSESVSLGFRHLAALLAPNAFNTTAGNDAFSTRLLFAGSVQFLLIALWAALRGFVGGALRRRMESLLIAAAVLALIPFVNTIFSSAPVFGLLSPGHCFIGIGFAFAFLAAAAAEEWVELDPEQCKTTLARLLVLVPAVWGAALALIVLVYVGVGGAPSAAARDLGGFGAAAAAVLAILAITLFRPRVRTVGYALSGLTFLSLAWSSQGALAHTPAARVLPETPFIASLREMNTRIGGSQALQSWPLAAHGIPQIYNPAGASLKRYEDFMDRTATAPLLVRRSGSQALVLTKQDIRGAYSSVRPVLNIQQVFPSGAVLFRDLESGPRARMIYAARTVEWFEPEALSPELPPLLEGAKLPAEDAGPAAAVSIVQPERNADITVNIQETRPGVLVLADTWYPGWIAEVDGRPAEILPVDGVFRGVEVGGGKHIVRFRYQPRSLWLGMGISALSALVVLAGLRPLWRRRRAVGAF